MRVGVSARLAKTALAEGSTASLDEIEAVWHALHPPYTELFAWLEGRAARPELGNRPTFTPLMLAQPLEDEDIAKLDPADYRAEWKWDGIRVQLVGRGGERRLYSRSGDDIGAAFPDLLAVLNEDVVLDGELLVMRDGTIAPFNDLQQRLNRKVATPKMIADYPAWVRLYDILEEGGEDLRPLSLRPATTTSRSMVSRGAAAEHGSSRRCSRSRNGPSCMNCATARASARSRG